MQYFKEKMGRSGWARREEQGEVERGNFLTSSLSLLLYECRMDTLSPLSFSLPLSEGSLYGSWCIRLSFGMARRL
jgi:hypothetical protein